MKKYSLLITLVLMGCGGNGPNPFVGHFEGTWRIPAIQSAVLDVDAKGHAVGMVGSEALDGSLSADGSASFTVGHDTFTGSLNARNGLTGLLRYAACERVIVSMERK